MSDIIELIQLGCIYGGIYYYKFKRPEQKAKQAKKKAEMEKMLEDQKKLLRDKGYGDREIGISYNE